MKGDTNHPESLLNSQIQSELQNPRLNPGHSPFQIASEPKVRDVRISPDSELILYQVIPFYRATDRVVSELWLARTNKPQSAIQLTNGEFNDRAGVFHPDGNRIVFLSDRNNPGKSTYIYTLPLGHLRIGYRREGDETIPLGEYAKTLIEPSILTSKFGKKPIQGFEVSPDGKRIAFASADETMPGDLRKTQEKNDAKVIGAKDGLARLRVYDFEADEIRTLTEIRVDKHIENFTWSPDSHSLLYRLRENKGSEWTEFEILLESISLNHGSAPKPIGKYPRSPSGSNVWLSSGHIASLQNYEPYNTLDARTLYIQDLTNPDVDQSNKIYGVEEDAVRILRGQTPNPSAMGNQKDHDFLAVEVSHDTDTHIDIITFSPSVPQHVAKFTLFHTSFDAIWFNSWDAKRVIDPTDPNAVCYVFAAVLSSGPRHEPPNVWSGKVRIQSNVTGVRELLDETQVLSRASGNLTKLSNHLEWLVQAPVLRTEVIKWQTNDGVELNGLVRFPPGYDPERGERLPAVLFIHGGPYRRDIPDYMPYFCNWRELFASAGYLTIAPNYRGSQGRGHNFARLASEGVGVYDWPDCESMVNEVIRRGWADSERLGVAGWSHGGSLTAWGVSQTRTRFKAAVVGAGATHWEGMVMESGSPELETAIGQSSPWAESAESANTALSSQRKKSPIHNLSGITTAVLILHGEKDERVPVGQALGLYRGLKRCAAARGKDAAQLVVYPREPHGFVERRHAQDVMERVLEYFNLYI